MECEELGVRSEELGVRSAGKVSAMPVGEGLAPPGRLHPANRLYLGESAPHQSLPLEGSEASQR